MRPLYNQLSYKFPAGCGGRDKMLSPKEQNRGDNFTRGGLLKGILRELLLATKSSIAAFILQPVPN